MRIQSTDTRERLWEQLREATDHQHTSQALNAARYYLRMYGDSPAQPTGTVNELLNAACAANGALDEQEIAEILDTSELGVNVEVTRQRRASLSGRSRTVWRRDYDARRAAVSSPAVIAPADSNSPRIGYIPL